MQALLGEKLSSSIVIIAGSKLSGLRILEAVWSLSPQKSSVRHARYLAPIFLFCPLQKAVYWPQSNGSQQKPNSFSLQNTRLLSIQSFMHSDDLSDAQGRVLAALTEQF